MIELGIWVVVGRMSRIVKVRNGMRKYLVFENRIDKGIFGTNMKDNI